MEKGSRRARLLRVTVVAQVAVTLGAFGAMRALGEHSRPTFFLLYLPRQPFLVAAIALLLLAFLAKKPRLVIAEVVALLIALFPLMGLHLEHSEKARGPSLRLLTYNVFYQRLDAEKLTQEIVAANADVIVLQASRTSYAARLREALPGFTVRVEDELLIATKLKIADVEVPEPWEDARQSWVRYTLEGPSGVFQLVNLHPTSARAGLFDKEDPKIATALRTRQIAAATEAARRSKDPVLLAGDTNLPELSVVAREYLGPFRDAFVSVGFGFGHTFPAKLPWMRIDRVLGGTRVHFLDARVMPRGASDHRAVVVDFEILPP